MAKRKFLTELVFKDLTCVTKTRPQRVVIPGPMPYGPPIYDVIIQSKGDPRESKNARYQCALDYAMDIDDSGFINAYAITVGSSKSLEKPVAIQLYRI